MQRREYLKATAASLTALALPAGGGSSSDSDRGTATVDAETSRQFTGHDKDGDYWGHIRATAVTKMRPESADDTESAKVHFLDKRGETVTTRDAERIEYMDGSLVVECALMTHGTLVDKIESAEVVLTAQGA